MAWPSLREILMHRPPMLLLDEILSFDGAVACCALTIRSDSMFIEHDRVPAWAALEYCAQCVAVFAGLQAHQRGEPPRMGFLVAARDLALETDFFHVGDRLLVEARLIFGEVRVGRFECAVKRGESTVATASISVYLPEEDAGG